MPHRLSGWVLVVAACCAQTADQPREAGLDPAAALVASSAGLRPEFAADVVLRLAETGKLPASEHPVELLERAFVMSGSAARQYRDAPVPIGFTDHPLAMIGLAGATSTDRLSLQCRAVKQMAVRDLGKALELFPSISLASVPKPACAEGLVPDLRVYYETLLSLTEAMQRAGTDEDEVETLLQSRIAGVGSASQVFPFAGVLSRVKWRDRERTGRLYGLFASAITGVSDSDRVFSVELFHEASRQAVQSLLDRAEHDGAASGALAAAFAGFYDKHLKGPRCADTFLDEPHRSQRAAALAPVNRRLTNAGVRTYLGDPNAGEVEVYESPRSKDFFESEPDYRELLLQVQRLPRTVEGDAEQREAYGRAVRSISDRLNRWERPPGVAPRQFFLMKSELFAGFISNTANGPLAGSALEAYVAFLAGCEGEALEYPAEFLWRVLRLLAGARPLRDRPVEAARFKEKVRGALLSTKSPTLHAYSRLQALGGLN